jgi:hypothetical protein
MIVRAAGEKSAGVPPEKDALFSDEPPRVPPGVAAPTPPTPDPAFGPTPEAPPKKRRTVKLSNPTGSARTTPPPVAPTPTPLTPPAATPPPEEDDDTDLTLPCPKCNAALPLDEDLCDACGYHRVLKKVLDTSDVYKPTTGTGFEKMIAGQIAEFESTESALLWAKVTAVVLLAIISFLCLGIWGLLFATVVVGVYLLWAAQAKQRVAAEESEINRDPLSIAVWQSILFVQRGVGWRELKWPFPKTRVLAMHDPEFSDDDLAELTGLKDVQTLDFEGARITDNGLVHFESLKGLRFVVLRRTQVTADGARRLQKLAPHAWIWY